MSSKKYYKNIDFIRVLACLAVLLYHFNILKGGYLAVCVFYVLSGYLSCMSAFKKEKLSLKDYYINRIIKIYIPLIVVVFLTIAVVSLCPGINWFNLKPETTSVLLGYNNFWQLGANLDYFARHINSPFIHLWYISILLQFNLIFPFVFLLFKKLGEKVHKVFPCVILGLVCIGTAGYFCYSGITQNIMFTYYNTFARLFSLCFGLFLGFIHIYFGPIVSSKFKQTNWSKVTFVWYSLILIFLFIFVDAQSKYFILAMIASSVIACRLIAYSVLRDNKDLNILDKVVRYLSKISYEIYLVQYPVIFLFQYINLPQILKLIIILVLILLISSLLHFVYSKDNKNNVFKYILGFVVLVLSMFGIVKYVLAIDHTSEMKQLEEQLAQNQEIIKQKQEEYKNKIEQENNELEELLKELENGEAQLKNIITNLSLVGIGDSVMLGAVPNLYKMFPNGYFDAAVSRTAWVAGGILQNLKNRDILGNPIILNLGANGDCPESCKKDIINKADGRKIFWINVTNDQDVHVNDEILSLSEKYDNVYVIDWDSVSHDHTEYFISDGIHLTEAGRKAYTKTIYDAIYEVYLQEYKNKMAEIIKDHEDKFNNRITFYGNDILLNCFNDISSEFSEDKFNVKKDFSYEMLKNEIILAKGNKSLTNNVVFAFDSSVDLTEEEYNNLIELLDGRKIYILLMNDTNVDNDLSNVQIIDFYNEISNHPEYIMVDKIHLTPAGNQALINILEENLKKQL